MSYLASIAESPPRAERVIEPAPQRGMEGAAVTARILPPDFGRDVVCVLGLPFDAIGVDAAVERVRSAAKARVSLLMATPNLNFVVTARHNARFRQAVLHSQLSLADGMPIVWIARLLGLPLRERVAGATLFEHLHRDSEVAVDPTKVYFFGAPEGVAERASQRINARASGVRCVGFESPGYGSVETMSTSAQIDRINSADPDFVVVALGAEKGLAWIDRAGPQLKAPVISHLGAVVGFTAGSIRRAPLVWQRMGLEWAWRIVQEPALWRRYWGDARVFAGLMLGSVLPLCWSRLVRALRLPVAALTTSGQHQADGYSLALRGGMPNAQGLANFRQQLGVAAASGLPVIVDVRELDYIDAAVMGLLLLLHGYLQDTNRVMHVVGVNARLRRQFRLHGAAYLLAAEICATSPGLGDRREVA